MIVDHRIAAIFDDDALSGEFLKPWQRLDQHFRLLVGTQIGMHVKKNFRVPISLLRAEELVNSLVFYVS